MTPTDVRLTTDQGTLTPSLKNGADPLTEKLDRILAQQDAIIEALQALDERLTDLYDSGEGFSVFNPSN